jgi:wobble nucleotide-excising tRNase
MAMMIEKITKIKKLGIFEDFDWGALPKLQKLNLIFGWNGYGKTTLSRMIRNFELGHVCYRLRTHTEAKYELEVLMPDGTAKKPSQDDLSGFDNIRVFNKDFVEENIFRYDKRDGDHISPIFYLGQARVELVKEKGDRSRQEADLSTKTQRQTSLISQKGKLERDTTQSIKDTFLGVKGFQTYGPSRYAAGISKIASLLKEGKTLDSLKISQEDFGDKLLTIKSDIVEDKIIEVKAVVGTLDRTFLEDINVNFLRKTVSVANVIKRLQADYEINTWVQVGLSIHKRKESKICEFCGQVLPAGLIADLEAHFNKDYSEFSNQVTAKLEEIKSLQVDQLDKIKDRDLKLNAEKINGVLDLIGRRLQRKKESLLEVLEISTSEIQDAVTEVSAVNIYLNGIESTFAHTATDLELSKIADTYEEYVGLTKSIDDLKIEIDEAGKIIKALDEKIKQAEKDLDDFDLPAEMINEDLEAFLGHNELIFTSDKDQDGIVYYQIKRGDDVAENLSESEKTAVSLVYFLRKLQEKDFNIREGVIFIDDPISSFDSQFLYSAYSFIVSAIEKSDSGEIVPQQVFISTHNYDFFNLLKRRYKSRLYLEDKSSQENKVAKRNCGVFMLQVDLNDANRRVAKICQLDRLLRKFDSDYQYLFSLLKKLSNLVDTKEQIDLERIYPYPNIARRVLETFLSFRFPQYIDDIGGQINATKADKRLKESVNRFINRKSHGSLIDMQGFDSAIVEPTAVTHILDVIELMRKEDVDHVKNLEDSIK